MAEIEIPERFRVVETIVDGDLEVLLRARDTILDREVLLKSAGPALALLLHTEQDRDRAFREARALARLKHPGVAGLLDVIDTGGPPLLVLEVIAGETLADRLSREGPVPPEEAARIGHVLADALDAVHAAGVLHRGLSARVIVLRDDGTPCLTDFTFAKFDLGALESSIDYDEALPVVPLHPGPEQREGQSGDARSDVYGLGCVLYQCLAGIEPERDPKPLSEVAPGTPAELAGTVMKAISKSPLKRFQTAAEIRDALAPAAPAPAASAPAPAEGRTGPARRFPLPAVAAAVVVVLLASAWAGGIFGAGEPEPAGPVDRGLQVGGGGTRALTEADGEFAPGYSASYALLVGIGDAYRRRGFPGLPNAERDVLAVAKQLESMTWEDWKVETLTGEEATEEAIRDGLARLESEADENARVLVYYAGHGKPHENSETSGWILPADAKPLEEDPGRSSWLHFDEFARLFDHAKAKHILVALDCCYSGRLAVGRADGASTYRDRFLTQRAHVVVTSGRPFEEVSDGVPGEGSPFAQAFVSALRSKGAPALTSSMLWARIDETFTERGVAHVPQMRNGPKSNGQFVFFLGGG